MTWDLLIRNGTVVDGTGAPGSRADVAVADGRVAEVGPDLTGTARRTIEADGAVITPGFVDIHTHLDAQIGWDPLLTSSCWHGVTSLVMGNCGVTFAPVRPDGTAYLAEMMESVEDIPAAAILEGLPFDWETYGDYLGWLDTRATAVHVGGMVGHAALRYWAMGERSVDEGAEPTAEELAEMVRLVDEAMAAGALGLSTSRTLRHRIPDGRNVPGTFAAEAELVALAEAMGRHGRGMFGAAPRFDGEGLGEERARSEVALMAAMSRASGRPFTFNLTNTFADPELWRQTLAFVRDANAEGARIRPQTTSRGIGVIFSLAHVTPFDRFPAWAELAGAPVAGKLAAFADPERRARLVAEASAADAEGFAEFFVLLPDRGARYDCDPEDSLLAHARRRGCTPGEAYVQLALESDGAVILNWPVLNQDFGVIAEMLLDPLVALGLADSGAHVGQILDASQPTFFLSYWMRERGLLPLEEAVRRLTSDTAALAGLADRGRIAPGLPADLNVIDLDALHLPLPTYQRDLPTGAGRFVQRAEGYRATVAGGEVTFEHGEHTGALPGTLLRAG